jgi:predicted helicase
MRKALAKKFGYIVIPVIVPSNIEPEVALDDNVRYKVVWTVLNALRAHDDRFNAIVNKLELNKSRPAQILVGKPQTSYDENGSPFDTDFDSDIADNLNLRFAELQNAVFAKMVQKVGERLYWEQWAKSVAELAEMHIERIKKMIGTSAHKQDFEKFLSGLQKNINPSISEADAIEMLSQHIITRPVFDALFEGYSFVQNNPISVSMQNMLNLLDDASFTKDTERLERFYNSVRKKAEKIDNAEAKQRIIIQLYDTFFKTAFPRMAERLGIVYTPVEVVDFIIHSVNDILRSEFGRSLSDDNVNIIDPFTGTGTFITRLLQSGIIRPEDLLRKYKQELFANEIVLLAYYIAAVNIENVFHDAFAANADA